MCRLSVAELPCPLSAWYVAAKDGLEAAADALRMEVARHNIQAVIILIADVLDARRPRARYAIGADAWVLIEIQQLPTAVADRLYRWLLR